MKKISILTATLLIMSFYNSSKAQEQFNVEIEPITITDAPALHSFSWGKSNDGKWVIVGGRKDGLHQRQPFASFLENDNNKTIYVVDPVGNQTWSADLSVLSAPIFEQLQSTNQHFYQRDSTLYVIGGYGFSATQNDHVTYDKLTAIDLNGVTNAVVAGNDITPYFRQYQDTIFAVTGGQLGYLDSVFYLAGGQYFKGRYNPMGPNNGPGFIQAYTDEIRLFKLNDDGTTITIYDTLTLHDQANLHRRDYNMTPQIFPNGEEGFTMWSGVFDANDLPFLNTVNITANTYNVNNNFLQYLSHYHSAKIPIYDIDANAMHTLFFGGMSQYTLDSVGNLVQDDNVPFVRTISRVTRLSNDSMQEVKLNIEMPTLVGSGAEFIPVDDTSIYYTHEILDINAIPQQQTLIGYIVGGIESTLPNIFFINDGTQSSASNVIFKVYINKSTVGMHESVLTSKQMYNLEVYPNPASNNININFNIPDAKERTINIYNTLGQKLYSKTYINTMGAQSLSLDISNYPKGIYKVRIEGQVYSYDQTFIKQ